MTFGFISKITVEFVNYPHIKAIIFIFMTDLLKKNIFGKSKRSLNLLSELLRCQLLCRTADPSKEEQPPT